MSTQLDANSQDTRVRSSTHGSYKISRIIPVTGQTLVLNSSITNTQTQLPDRVFNYKPSTYDYTQNIGAPGANKVTYLHTLGLQSIDRVSYGGNGNTKLIDQAYTDMFTRMVWGVKTSLKDFLSYSDSLGADTEANANVLDAGFNFSRSNDRSTIFTMGASTTAGTPLNEAPKVVPSPNNGYSSVRISGAGVATFASLSYTEPQYFKQSAANVDIVVNHKIPLAKLCPHSVFESHKDVTYGQQMTLTVFYKALSGMGWVTPNTNLSDIATSAANIASVCNLTNIRVSLAIETDEFIVNYMRNELRTKGFRYTIPWVRGEQLVPAISSSINHLVKINRGDGIRLLNIYSAVSNSATAGRLGPDISNNGLAGVKKILTMQEAINGSNLTEFTLDATKKDDWAEMKDLLADSVYGQNSDVWDHNRVFCRSFRSGKCVDWNGDSDVVIDGKELSGDELNYSIQYNMNDTPALYQSYIFMVLQKELIVNPSGVMTVQ